jgi:hypothetical protein
MALRPHGIMIMTILGAALVAGRTDAATLLFLNSGGEYVGGGKQQLFTPADGTFSANSSALGVEIDFDGGIEHSWSLDFVAPMDAPVAVGAYEMAERFPFQSPDRPGLSVTGEGRGCNTLSGRFVVLDVVYGAGGQVESFAADFEQHCEEGPHPLTGSIRYNAGDLSCASEGAACDDLDACTGASTCHAGTCAGDVTVACPVAQSGCSQTGLCDPASGTCATALASDGTGCQASACSAPFGSCMAGQCIAEPISCDDGDFCTDDACDPALGRCVSTPAPCWTITGRTTATAFIPGRSVTRSRRFTGVILLREDGTYRAPGGLEACPTGTVTVPDEVGTLRQGSRGRLFLQPSNLGDLLTATSECAGRPIVLRSYRAWVKPLANGVLRGMVRLVARAHAGGQTITIVAVSRFVGGRRSAPAGAVAGAGGANIAALAESQADVVPGSD